MLQELHELDIDEDPDPAWVSQYEVQEIPDLDYELDEFVPPGETSAPEEAGDKPASGDMQPQTPPLSANDTDKSPPVEQA